MGESKRLKAVSCAGSFHLGMRRETAMAGDYSVAEE
jgi:hypothetical protein